MPDIVLVPSAVVPGASAQYVNSTAGATLQAGDAVYIDPTSQQCLLADSSDVLKSKVRGICSHAASLGQPVKIQISGMLHLGDDLLTVAEMYVLSPTTPGKIAPISDMVAGDFLTVLGVGQTTSLLSLRIWNTELARAA